MTKLTFLAFAAFMAVMLMAFAFLNRQKKKKQHKENQLNHRQQMQLLAENFPFGLIIRTLFNDDSENTYFNSWTKKHFSPLENESQWQAIENQLSENSLSNFLRVRSQFYSDNRGFELQLSFVGGQRYLARGFHILRPYPTYIILLRPSENLNNNENQRDVNLNNQIAICENKLENALNQKQQMQKFYHSLLNELTYPVWIRRNNGDIEFSNKAAQIYKIASFLENPPTKINTDEWSLQETLFTSFGGYIGFATRHVKTQAPSRSFGDNAIQQLAPALQNINQAIALFDSQGYLQWFNNSLCQMWHLPAERLKEKPNFQNFYYMLEDKQVLKLLDPKKWLERQLGYFHHFHGTENERLEMGDLVIQQKVVRAGQDHLAWIFEDVSDNYSLQRQLRTSSDVRLRALNSINDALMLVSPSGLIEYINPALTELWQIPSGFFEDRPRFSSFLHEIIPYIVTHDENLPQDEEGWRNLLMDRQGAQGEIEWPDRGLWLYFESRHLPDGSQFIRWQNQTSYKALNQEKELRSRALQSALERMVAFIQDVSVEVRQPTSNIQGLSELLASQKFGALNDRQSEYAHNIVSESQKLTSVVQDILDVASIDAGHLQLEIQPVHVVSLIHSALQLIENRLNRKNQKIKADFPSHFSPMEADELRLRQILYSLLALASDFGRSPGEINFSSREDSQYQQLIFQMSFTCAPTKKLRPMVGSLEHFPLEAAGQLELTHRLIKLHQGQILFSYKGDNIEISLSLPMKNDKSLHVV